MASLRDCSAFLVSLLCCFSVSLAGEFCSTSSYGLAVTYCTYGCCGYYPREYCCSPAVGMIVGCVCAGIVGVCIMVAVVCYFVKRGQSGRVLVQPGVPSNNGVTVVSAGHTYAGASYGPPGGVQPTQPPAYGANLPVPPPYQYNNPAYPPSHPATANNPFAAATAKS